MLSSMVNLPAEDAESLSGVMKDKHKSSDLLGLLVNLKIPKEEPGMNAIADQKIIGFAKNHEITNKITSSNNNTKRVCHFCQKVFNSGKALGGHMRIHVQQSTEKTPFSLKKKLMKVRHADIKFKKQNPRDLKAIDLVKKVSSSVDTIVIKKPTTCLICGKDFPTMKSLFGHMRCHPDRVWRGIHPPSDYMAKNSLPSSSSSSFSSSLSDAAVEQSKNVHQIETLGSCEGNGMVDLMESLSGWSVTAPRGRKAAAGAFLSEDTNDEETLEAVNALMMLSRSRNLEESTKKLDGEDDSDGMKSKNTTKATVMMKNKKKRKRVKLCDLEITINNETSPLHHHKVVDVMRDDKYIRERSLLPEDDSDDSLNPIITQFVEETNVRPSSVLEFDLNEVPCDDP